MHSRVFQIERKAVDKEKRMRAIDIPEWFINDVSDYVIESEDRERDIEWLMSGSLKDVCTRVGDKLSFTSDAEAYFKERYESFLECAKKLVETSFEEFISGYHTEFRLAYLRDTFCEKTGFYVYNEEFGLIPIDIWARKIKSGDVYYIGGVLDYHR